MPAKSLAAAADFQAAGIDVSAFENVEEIFWRILADDSDEPYWREERGGIVEVDGAAADDVVAPAGGGFDRIDADGASDEEGHSETCKT